MIATDNGAYDKYRVRRSRRYASMSCVAFSLAISSYQYRKSLTETPSGLDECGYAISCTNSTSARSSWSRAMPCPIAPIQWEGGRETNTNGTSNGRPRG